MNSTGTLQQGKWQMSYLEPHAWGSEFAYRCMTKAKAGEGYEKGHIDKTWRKRLE
jgi:hypothetical protein